MAILTNEHTVEIWQNKRKNICHFTTEHGMLAKNVSMSQAKCGFQQESWGFQHAFWTISSWNNLGTTDGIWYFKAKRW
jgi:hypothetical protein